MKYDTIIFDLDGTLLNTLEDLRDSLNTILLQEGYNVRTLEEVRHFVGNGVKMLVKRSLPYTCDENEVIRITNLFQTYYKLNMQIKTKPYDGIMELLSYLKDKHYKTAIVSNKFDTAVKALANIYFSSMISVAIGETADVRRKPAPDSIYKAVSELGSDISKAVLVGDSETDILTAKNAGIPCIGVTWGFRGRDILIKEGADYLIDTPNELIDLI
jgi:phosphoglycolate phosphatase